MIAVGREEGGALVLQKVCENWLAGKITAYTQQLWTAAVVTPADCGLQVAEPGQQPKRKLRIE